MILIPQAGGARDAGGTRAHPRGPRKSAQLRMAMSRIPRLVACFPGENQVYTGGILNFESISAGWLAPRRGWCWRRTRTSQRPSRSSRLSPPRCSSHVDILRVRYKLGGRYLRGHPRGPRGVGGSLPPGAAPGVSTLFFKFLATKITTSLGYTSSNQALVW